MTKLRLSNHNLMIEKGRHNKVEHQLRFCIFCPNCIEDEYHFVMICPVYAMSRQKLLDETNIRNYRMTNWDTFVALMTENCCVEQTAEFINNANYIRDFLTKSDHNGVNEVP